MTPSCILRGHVTDPIILRASDRYHHTTVITATGEGEVFSLAAAPLVASAVITPAHETVLPTLDPVDLVIGAYALDGLRAVTVTINGTDYAAATWP